MEENNMEEIHTIVVIDDEEREIECEVLFTFNSAEYEKDYIVYAPLGDQFTDEEGNVTINTSSYLTNEHGEVVEIAPIEDDAEWDMIEEVIASFIDDMGENDEPIS